MIQQTLTHALKIIRYLFLNGIWLALWLFSGGIFFSYLLRWWPGERWALIRLMSSLTPWLLIGLLPGVFLAWLGRRHWLLITLAIPTLFISFTYAPLFMPRVSPALASDTSLKVMSYNIWRRNNDVEAVAAIIHQETPDIILLQELNVDQADVLLEQLEGLYPEADLHFAHQPAMLQGVISRYPIIPAKESWRGGRLQKVIVNTPAGNINVWNAHTKAFPWRMHYPQLVEVSKDLATVEGPLILGGDFNTTEQLNTYRLISRHLYNAHWQAGWGFGFSFPAPNAYQRRDVSPPSLIRIDHIFYNDYFYAQTAATLSDSGGSDHLPVVATLVWRQ